ncbi:uncharacterized protein LOC122320087 [Drosophila ficusphila]|uniref:uncharacterized protein LOC122320087 n=1 Tax=Drosophila ficusphila TaxID=30025 RepID=UPI001C8911E7|nr:uncharacterized protein LOC122320087 [Drosophila ficusphila]
MGTQMLIRCIQMSNLADDYWRLHSKQQISSSSPLSSLLPFIDSFGLMRVGGRLQNSSLDYNAQHTAMPASSYTCHYTGLRALLAHMRLQFWPIGGRKTVSAATSKCVICFRAKPQLSQHIMADLPKDRVNATSTLRFITKPEFEARGKPVRIWSDNATNFVGAKNELAELKNLFLSSPHIRAIEEFCLEDSIEVRFIPSRSPHFGGLWEAAVKTAKFHFYQNPADLEALTSAHFLGTVPLVLYSEPDVTKLNFNRLDRWKRISYFQQIFWSGWREEYLTLLQQRSKRRTPKPVLQINDIVLVQNEILPPLKWPLARVMELVPGSDGVSRVAVIRTSTGVTRRAVRQLCVLPKLDLVESPRLPTGETYREC